MSHVEVLTNLIASNNLQVAPGVFDGIGAKLVEKCGFNLVYASGGAISRSSGYPDLGLLSFTEVCDRLAKIVTATSLPVIADADTGFGNEINVDRTVREYEKIGVAGLHIEDQVFPKRCGHLCGKQLVARDEMVLKLKVALKAKQNPNLCLIARTDAIAVEGFQQAIDRAKAYIEEGGADMIFVEAPETVEQIEKIAHEIPYPKLINMFYGGKTPLVPLSTLTQWGYNIVIIPSDLQRAAMKAMEKALEVIYQDGDSSAMGDELITFDQREQLIETAKYLALSKMK